MWFIFALIGALFKSFTNYFRKRISGNVSTEVYLWVNLTVFLLILSPFVIIRNEPVYELITTLPLIIFSLGLTSNLAVTFNILALKREQLSYIAPLNAFIPVFTLFLAAMFLGEAPPLMGVIGIMSVFVGAYIMNLKSEKVKWYEPILRALNNTGARFAVAMAIAFALNTTLLKAATNSYFSALSIMYANALAAWLLLAYVPIKNHAKIGGIIKRNAFILAGASLSSILGVFFGILALEGTFASYAISVRRLDIIFSILLGWRLLKETSIKIKLVGGSFMTAGVALLALS